MSDGDTGSVLGCCWGFGCWAEKRAASVRLAEAEELKDKEIGRETLSRLTVTVEQLGCL